MTCYRTEVWWPLLSGNPAASSQTGHALLGVAVLLDISSKCCQGPVGQHSMVRNGLPNVFPSMTAQPSTKHFPDGAFVLTLSFHFLH